MAKRVPANRLPARTTDGAAKEAYIRFMAPVMPNTAMALMRAIDAKLAGGATRIHLMISSPGGSVFHGLSISNFLRGAPVEVYTYNFGSVDSIGVAVFCAGQRRLSVPHARFLIHGVSINFQGNHVLDEKGLEEKLKGLKIDYQNIAKLVADTCGKKADEVVRDMNDRTTLNPPEAIKYGLVHEIQAALFPADADLSVIHEDGSQSSFKQAGPHQMPVPQFVIPPQLAAIQPQHIQHVTVPSVQAFTEPDNANHGTFF